MKKSRYLIIFVGMVMVLSIIAEFTYTGKSNRQDEFGTVVLNVKPEYVSEWIENDYTKHIVEPEAGEMDYVLDYSAVGRYCIWFKNITKEQSDKYVKALQQEQGFTKVASRENNVTIGTCFRKNDIELNVSYSETALGILITMKTS